MSVEEGDTATFSFSYGVGLPLLIGAKLVSINDKPSIFSLIIRLFRSRDEIFLAPHFVLSGWTYSELQGTSLEFFTQKIEDLTCLCSTLSTDLAKKNDPRLKPSNMKEITYLTHF